MLNKYQTQDLQMLSDAMFNNSLSRTVSQLVLLTCSLEEQVSGLNNRVLQLESNQPAKVEMEGEK